jgi:hypothetical protein
LVYAIIFEIVFLIQIYSNQNLLFKVRLERFNKKEVHKIMAKPNFRTSFLLNLEKPFLPPKHPTPPPTHQHESDCISERAIVFAKNRFENMPV